MAGTIGSVGGSPAADQTTGQTQSKPKDDVSKEAFMQLLVSQIKNQNPLNPTDGVQFLSQLAQFSELEQLINIKDELSDIHKTIGQSPNSMDTASGRNSSSNV